MAEPFIGQIIAVGFNFVPVGWLPCNGQLVSISEYDVLFALIGTTYGGDGVSSFALPDLRGRTPISSGQGPGRSNYTMGQQFGSETVTLLANQVGPHSHPLLASSQAGTTNTPGSGVALATSAQTAAFLYTAPPTNVPMSSNAIGVTGNSQPHENRQPYLAVNYIICFQGIFPSRS